MNGAEVMWQFDLGRVWRERWGRIRAPSRQNEPDQAEGAQEQAIHDVWPLVCVELELQSVRYGRAVRSHFICRRTTLPSFVIPPPGGASPYVPQGRTPAAPATALGERRGGPADAQNERSS